MDQKIAKSIIKFISTEPRAVSEVAQHISKSWKTADKYLLELKKDHPEVQIKVFRKGSHGALKVAYLQSVMHKSNDEIKDKFFNAFLTGKVKDDFDVLDFFMQVKSEQKDIILEPYEEENISTKQDLINLLRSCQETLYCFTGNLSWINMKEQDTPMLKILEELVNRGVKIKILSRIDAASLKNIYKLKSLDKKNNTNLIEVRHQRHPLRGFIVDDKTFRLKEEIRTGRYKKGEINQNLRLFYNIWDQKWVNWLTNVFYYSYNSSMGLDNYEDIIKKINNHI